MCPSRFSDFLLHHVCIPGKFTRSNIQPQLQQPCKLKMATQRLILVFILFCFGDRVSCCPGWPGMYYIANNVLEVLIPVCLPNAGVTGMYYHAWPFLDLLRITQHSYLLEFYSVRCWSKYEACSHFANSANTASSERQPPRGYLNLCTQH